MLDCETWSTRSDAALLQIGAVAFSFNETLEVHEHLQKEALIFTAVIDPFEDYAGVVYGEDTRSWWAHPDRARAMASILETGERMTPAEAVAAFATWVPRNLGKRARVWAKPPQFDCAILRHHFNLFGIECPWHWRQEADLRTLVWAAQHVLGAEFHAPSLAGTGLVDHNALHDAAEQATLAQAALRAISLHERKFGPVKRSAAAGTA